MSIVEEKKLLTIAEYLEAEDAAELRHEFQNGKTIELAGGTLAHNVIKGEIYTLVNIGIKSAKIPHMALNSDTKVRIEAANRFLYPDVTVSAGTPAYYTTPDGHKCTGRASIPCSNKNFVGTPTCKHASRRHPRRLQIQPKGFKQRKQFLYKSIVQVPAGRVCLFDHMVAEVLGNAYICIT